MKRNIATILTVIVLCTACTKDDKALTIANQEAAIDSYIASTLKDYPLVRNNGSNRVIVEEALNPSAKVLEYGDSLYFYYAGYVFTSSPSTLFATNVEEVAIQSGFEITDPDFSVMKIPFEKGSIIVGLENGLAGTKEGEHCVILFSAQYGFYSDAVYNIPRLSALAFEIWIDKVIKNQ